jgi:V8-like Glu-specific endopeptidase
MFRTFSKKGAVCVGLAAALLLSSRLNGQVAMVGQREEPTKLASETWDNSSTDEKVVFVGTAESPGAATIRLHISDYDLGAASYLTLVSLADGDVQRLDGRTIPESYDWSALFNGDAVDVQLHVAPGDLGVFVEIDGLQMPNDEYPPSQGGVATICGTNDDRVGSNDSRVGRLSTGCTVWLVSNGAALTAGHCGVPAGAFVEFNVPPSLVNGRAIAAAAVDQYPVDVGTVMSENNGDGQDWMIFGLNTNTTTGRTAHNVQGFFRMIKYIPANGTAVRVTGYGIDNAVAGTGTSVCNGGTNHNGNCFTNANCTGGGTCLTVDCCDPDGPGPLGCGNNCNSASQTLQTTIGTIASSNTDLIRHTVDTMPANSGSPIIWDQPGLTVGIHTAGGCTSSGGDNRGTRFSRAPLETAVRNFAGPNPVYVDSFVTGLAANGGVFEPYHAIVVAVGAVADGGTISLVPGTYLGGNGNRFIAGADGKAMTFVSPAGASIIGQ